MGTILNSATPLVDFLWQDSIIEGGFTTPERLARLEVKLNGIASSIGDEVVAGNYRSTFRNRLWDTFKARKNRGGGFTKGSYKNKEVGESAQKVQCLNRMQQKVALAGLINYPLIFEELEERFTYFFSENDFKGVFSAMQIAVMQGVDTAESMLNYLHTKGFSDILSIVLSNNIYMMQKQFRPNKDEIEARKCLEHFLELLEIKKAGDEYIRIAHNMAKDENGLEKMEDIQRDARLNEARLIFEDD